MSKRPSSLREVAARSDSAESFSLEVADFLHEFQRARTLLMLEEEPGALAGRFAEGDTADAYLAAVAAHLADLNGWRRPRWTSQPQRYLSHPWFAVRGPAMRACLLLESPAPFRERNLFVTANALEVA